MIVDLEAFVARERAYWQELERALDEFEAQPDRSLGIEQALRVHYLVRRAAAALAKLGSLPLNAELRGYVESLLARAFVELGADRSPRRPYRQRVRRLLASGVPAAFRRQLPAFGVAVAVTLLGAAFGALAVAADIRAKEYLLPFPELLGEPGQRVAREESNQGEHSHAATFAAILMANNISVSLRAFALGALFGIGTLVILFYNGVVLGAVAYDYASAGYTQFLLGWLLPHGAVEIPAILIAAQAGLVLGRAVLGRGDGTPLGERLRAVSGDLVALLVGTALLLTWAGVVESFFSQYHAPVLPYAIKIAFGVLELGVLFAYLLWPRRSAARGELSP